jgi:hypothetical protein
MTTRNNSWTLGEPVAVDGGESGLAGDDGVDDDSLT